MNKNIVQAVLERSRGLCENRRNNMNLRLYQEKSTRTLNINLTSKEQTQNMIIGVIGETGEIADIFKKHLYQGHDLDSTHLEEEIGDVMFYLVNLCSLYGLDMENIIEDNYTKLKKRFPNGFETERSVNR